MSRQGEDLKIDSEDGGGEFSKSLSTEQTFNVRQCRNKRSMPLMQSFLFFRVLSHHALDFVLRELGPDLARAVNTR